MKPLRSLRSHLLQSKGNKEGTTMKNRMHCYRYGLHLSATLRVVLIALVCAGTGAGKAWSIDEGWPRQKQQDGHILVYYQPQLDSWENQKVLKARIA